MKNKNEVFSLPRFFADFPLGLITPRRLERLVIRSFNKNLEMMPYGVGPRDIIDDGLRLDWIKKTITGPTRYYLSDGMVRRVRVFLKLAA